MANPKKAVQWNVDGDFFVDSTCINCDTCRQLAPHTFVDAGPYSSVFHQPQTAMQEEEAFQALLCCPTGSIGTRGHNKAKEVLCDFPLLIDEDVFYTGFNSEKSYGANAFFIKHSDGNWLVDAPKYLPQLARALKDLGGIRYIFLTHRDDVADAALYAKEFGAERIIHKDDLDAEPDSEIVISGKSLTEHSADFKFVPVPGHTRGHMVLIYKDKYLFSGDHLHFDREEKHLAAYREVCWYSWREQTKSMNALTNYSFEWVLAGHGDRVHLAANEMQKQLGELVERMRKTG